MRTREELAWAAGVFDGEGWASSARYSPKTGGKTATLTLGVGQADREMPDRLVMGLGIGNVYGPGKRVTGRTPMFSFKVFGFEHVQAVTAMIWPWLGTPKRKQLSLVLEDARLHPTRRRKFSEPQLAEIRRRIRAGEDDESIARRLVCSPGTIRSIANGNRHNRGVSAVIVLKPRRERPKRAACSRGHILTEENTRLYRSRRLCRLCLRIYGRAWKRTKHQIPSEHWRKE